MHLSCCEHPVKIFNKYLNTVVSVPCGKCNVCRNTRNSLWVQRLECERLHSTYTIFFTLTYADEYLPLLKYVPSSSGLEGKFVHIQRDFSKLNKRFNDEYNNFEIPVSDTILSERSTKNIMRLHADCLPYCSVYDMQTFFKRFRSRLYRMFFGRDSDIPESSKIRYFYCAEYGPTSLRPHYHGVLFFDDSQYKEDLRDILSSSWSFGRVDIQYVQSSATSYVASYLNCSYHLPRVYQQYGLRPFHNSTKSTPIGLRSFTQGTIDDVFFTSSYLIPVKDSTLSKVSLVPIWRSLEDRLFPKLPYNCTLDSICRLELFRLFTSCRQDSFSSFCQDIKILSDKGFSTTLIDYFTLVIPSYTKHFRFHVNFYDESVINRIYYFTRRLSSLCSYYRIGLVDYNNIFDIFVSNRELYRLQTQYLFEEDFSAVNDSRFLLNLDRLKFDFFRSCLYSDLTYKDKLILFGFGFTDLQLKDIYKDEFTCKSFFRDLHFSRTLEFSTMVATHKKIFLDTHKVRKKNEWLQKHPEFNNLY